jgi:DNA-nicking Smr family endonuclease
MQSKRKTRVRALAELKLLVTDSASVAPKKADAPSKVTHKNKGNHGGSSASLQASRPARVSASDRQACARPDGSTPVSIENQPMTAFQATLDGKDAALFRRAMANVERIQQNQLVHLPVVRLDSPDVMRQRREYAAGKESAPLATLSDDFAAATSSQDDTRFLRHGHGPDVMKNLKLGKWPIQASLDLHGATIDDARERLDRFLHSCITHKLRCVLIVHGKGYGSQDGESVLKTAVRRWLVQLADVIAYTETPAPRGGSGAVQILLKAAKAE